MYHMYHMYESVSIFAQSFCLPVANQTRELLDRLARELLDPGRVVRFR